ncbi:hypothetical protein Pmani_025871 [Petrolisthes manimaculis]|uniref:Uncharacterized protein n=1 Tax=Petrolisthes manimaculis TaxID=1843537 RepID=A0AAE1P4N2_9EUCA|nr:hypothetical protein Pmani_025871 [Petrolisthes manimaculis]
MELETTGGEDWKELEAIGGVNWKELEATRGANWKELEAIGGVNWKELEMMTGGADWKELEATGCVNWKLREVQETRCWNLYGPNTSDCNGLEGPPGCLIRTGGTKWTELIEPRREYEGPPITWKWIDLSTGVNGMYRLEEEYATY